MKEGDKLVGTTVLSANCRPVTTNNHLEYGSCCMNSRQCARRQPAVPPRCASTIHTYTISQTVVRASLRSASRQVPYFILAELTALYLGLLYFVYETISFLGRKPAKKCLCMTSGIATGTRMVQRQLHRAEHRSSEPKQLYRYLCSSMLFLGHSHAVQQAIIENR